MDFEQYDGEVHQWIDQVLANREIDAGLTLEYSRKIIEYGKNTGDCKLMGFGYYYCGETYYGLNDGAHFFDAMCKAISSLNQVEEWEMMVRCYNFLGIAAQNRGNIPIALDYYLSGLHYCRTCHLQEMTILLNVNLGVLYIECEQYQDAEAALMCAYDEQQKDSGQANYYSYLFCIYGNLARCYVLEDRMEQAAQIIRQVHTLLWKYGDDLDKLPICCVEALYCHRKGILDKRDELIEAVSGMIPENLNVLDFFYDFYTYCLMLLEAGKEEDFWQILGMMEPLVQNFHIINLQLKVISLKIKFYRKHNQNAEYLQACGLYYELSEQMETENRSMAGSIVRLRKNLELVENARLQAEEEKKVLKQQSRIDSLTGMANRFMLNERSGEMFARAKKNATALTVEILDIDYFKQLNDNYGHQEGDRCLVQVARTIQQVADKRQGFAARYGGDEFVVIYEGFTRQQSMEAARELKQAVMDLTLEHRYSKVLPIVTISQGLCLGIPREEDHIGDFLHTADVMLYRVKNLKRNNYGIGDVDQTEIEIGDP